MRANQRKEKNSPIKPKVGLFAERAPNSHTDNLITIVTSAVDNAKHVSFNNLMKLYSDITMQLQLIEFNGLADLVVVRQAQRWMIDMAIQFHKATNDDYEKRQCFLILTDLTKKVLVTTKALKLLIPQTSDAFVGGIPIPSEKELDKGFNMFFERHIKNLGIGPIETNAKYTEFDSITRQAKIFINTYMLSARAKDEEHQPPLTPTSELNRLSP